MRHAENMDSEKGMLGQDRVWVMWRWQRGPENTGGLHSWKSQGPDPTLRAPEDTLVFVL